MNEDLQGVMDFIIARDEEIEADYQSVIDFIIARDEELVAEECFVVSGDNEGVTLPLRNGCVTVCNSYKESYN